MLQRCVFAVISKLNLGKQNSGFPFTPDTDNEKCCNIIWEWSRVVKLSHITKQSAPDVSEHALLTLYLEEET